MEVILRAQEAPVVTLYKTIKVLLVLLELGVLIELVRHFRRGFLLSEAAPEAASERPRQPWCTPERLQLVLELLGKQRPHLLL